MIAGIGTDIVATARMRTLYAKHGSRAAERILAMTELADFAQSRDPARFLAKRFAAKEALGKALGIGVAFPATLHNVAVIHDALGKPAFEYAPVLSRFLLERNLIAHLSISDEQDSALAFVVLERS